MPVAFVAQVADALDQLEVHHLGDALHHLGFVGLVRYVGEDDGLTVVRARLDLVPAAHDDGAAAGRKRLADTAAAHDQSAGREIRAGDDLQQFIERDFGVVEVG